MPNAARFMNKIVFVTGAASGIGRASTVAFAAEGAKVATLDRTEDALKEVEAAVREAGSGELLPVSRTRG